MFAYVACFNKDFKSERNFPLFIMKLQHALINLFIAHSYILLNWSHVFLQSTIICCAPTDFDDARERLKGKGREREREKAYSAQKKETKLWGQFASHKYKCSQ